MFCPFALFILFAMFFYCTDFSSLVVCVCLLLHPIRFFFLHQLIYVFLPYFYSVLMKTLKVRKTIRRGVELCFWKLLL